MRRMIAIAAVVLMGMGLVACDMEESPSEETRPLLDSAGKVVTGPNGEVVYVTRKLQAAYKYYEAQQEANKPVFEWEIPAGSSGVSLPAGTKMIVRVPGKVQQHVPGYVLLVREAKDGLTVFGVVDRVASMGENMAGRIGSRDTKITTTGDNSPATNSGGGANVTVTPTTTTTTTTTTGTEGGTVSTPGGAQ